MAASILNAAPKALLQGIRDIGGGNVPVIAEAIPCSLPHLFLFTSEGTTEPQLVIGGSATKTFGNDVFALRGKYTTHQTVMASIFNEAANSMMIQRLKPIDAAPPAQLTLSLEVVSSPIPIYEREADGSLIRDEVGLPIMTENSILGHKARWILNDVVEVPEMGGRETHAGDLAPNPSLDPELEPTDPVQSTVYPIMDLEVSSFGNHGNLKGIRLWAPTTASASGTDSASVLANSAFLYKMQMIAKADVNSQAKVVSTLGGSQSVDFTFKEGSLGAAVGNELDVEAVVLDAYRNLEVQPRQMGPFNEMHVYRDNIETVSKMIFDVEKVHQDEWATLSSDDGADVNIVNLVGGENLDGIAYTTFEVVGVSSGGGIKLTQNSNHYAVGGYDGTMNDETFNALVKAECADYKFKDMAFWPQSSLWDSGFSLDTTKSMFNVLGVRKDMYVIGSTQDVSAPQNTVEQDSSAGIALRAAARAFPESEIFGTETCRAVIVEQSGLLANSLYKGLMPLTLELARMVAEFMGASNGIWKRNRGFDESPRNQFKLFKSTSIVGTYKDPDVYAKNWDIGLVWAQTFDRSKLFFPQTQTVYADSTSPLNSLINMACAVEGEKVCDRAWRQLTGGSKLTPAQFLERSDELVTELMSEARFDDRFIIRPRTFFTDIDAELGYSWSCEIEIFMNNMMTVGTYTVIANRRANFVG